MSSFAVAFREHSFATTSSVLYFRSSFFCALVQSDSLLALFRMINFNAPFCGGYIGVLFSWVFSVRSLIAAFPVPSLAVVFSVPSYAEVFRVLSCSNFSSAPFVSAFLSFLSQVLLLWSFLAGGGVVRCAISRGLFAFAFVKVFLGRPTTNASSVDFFKRAVLVCSFLKVLYLHSSVRAFSVRCITCASSAAVYRGIVPCALL